MFARLAGYQADDDQPPSPVGRALADVGRCVYLSAYGREGSGMKWGVSVVLSLVSAFTPALPRCAPVVERACLENHPQRPSEREARRGPAGFGDAGSGWGMMLVGLLK